MAANVFVAENLHLAPQEVIVTINEALRTRAVPLHSARRAIQPLPSPFVLVALVTNPTHYDVPLPAPATGGSGGYAARGDGRSRRRRRRRGRVPTEAASASSLPLGERLQRPCFPLPVPLFFAEQALFSVSLAFDHPCTGASRLRARRSQPSVTPCSPPSFSLQCTRSGVHCSTAASALGQAAGAQSRPLAQAASRAGQPRAPGAMQTLPAAAAATGEEEGPMLR